MMAMLRQNEGFSEFFIDDEYAIHLGARMTPEGGRDLFEKMDDDRAFWESIPWIVFLGALAMETDINQAIHRTERRDLSLF